MKHLLIPAAALLALAACNSRPENSFVINGTINGADGEPVYFSYDNGNGFIYDTATIADGKFTFTGEVPPFGSHGYIEYGKEKEVARLVSEGLLNKQIADELGIAERTVQTHRTMVYRKLDAKNNIEVYKILSKLKVLS